MSGDPFIIPFSEQRRRRQALAAARAMTLEAPRAAAPSEAGPPARAAKVTIGGAGMTPQVAVAPPEAKPALPNKPLGPGYSGMGLLAWKETDVGEYQRGLELNEAATPIDVEPTSPAFMQGMRKGMLVTEINGEHPLTVLQGAPLKAGSLMRVRVLSRLGILKFEFPLAERAKAKGGWKLRQAPPKIAPGATVAREDRFRWLTNAVSSKTLSLTGKTVATWLVLKCIQRDGTARVKHATIAASINSSRSAVQRALKELKDHGLVRIDSGRSAARSNKYVLTHPAEPNTNVRGIHDAKP